MIVILKWFLTGKTSEFEDTDDIIGPQTTILEIKGLVQMRFGFPANQIILIHKRLLENHETLESIGIRDARTAKDIILTVHAVRDEGLEAQNAVEGEIEDDGIMEFSHDDFALAMKMLGKDVPVSSERLKQVREHVPKSRPRFLDNPKPAPLPAATGESSEMKSATMEMFSNTVGLQRKDGVEDDFAIVYPGVSDSFQFWDLRLPESVDTKRIAQAGEIALELFFFGEFRHVEHKKFIALVQCMLEGQGIRPRFPLPPREAGCMYPLVGLPVVLSDSDAELLGSLVFAGFGTQSVSQSPQRKAQPGSCAQQ
jgi:hypothetical protein